MTSTASVDLLDTLDIDHPQADACVIWCHGLGADGQDFLPIVDDFAAQGLQRVRYVFPHAPKRPITLNQGMLMRGWYDIRTPTLTTSEDKTGIEASAASIRALIDREIARGIQSRRIVLGGFSQGCAMALYVGNSCPQPLAGIIGLSGYLPLIDSTAGLQHPANQHTPFWMAHGTQDPIVPMARGIAARDQLTALGYAVQWHTYPMGHSVCAPELSAIATFLKATLAAN